jgi:hypothetical protein
MVFAPPWRDFVAEFIPQSGAPQLLFLHPRQISNGLYRDSASVLNKTLCTVTCNLLPIKFVPPSLAALARGRRSTAVNKITIPGLILNSLATLYRDTHIIRKALYLDCKNTRHASLITASEALSPDAGILLAASIRSATLSNYTAGPSDCLKTYCIC